MRDAGFCSARANKGGRKSEGKTTKKKSCSEKRAKEVQERSAVSQQNAGRRERER